MANKKRAKDPRTYRVGIDVGTHSVGLAAIEVDGTGQPVSVLSAISHIHDSGVLEAKTAETRLAAAGIARRMRRLRRRRSKRLRHLDAQLSAWGWMPLEDSGDPYLPWRARARLATERISDPRERDGHLATALAHMARHRGWRNPYVRVASLYEPAPPSTFMSDEAAPGKDRSSKGLKQRVEERTGTTFPADVTVAELAMAAINHGSNVPLRMGKTENRRVDREFSYLGGKLLQSDNANELHAYARVQGLSTAKLREIIDLVFEAESPRGSWVGKIGKDPLDNNPRAAKATDAFQRFRIATVLANVRVRDGEAERRLQAEELQRAFDYLVNVKPGDQPAWGDIGEAIGLTRKAMSGTASTTADGDERLPLRPPILVTDHVIRRDTRIDALKDFWTDADNEHRDALIDLLVDGAKDDDSQAGIAAWELQQSLTEDDLTKLDTLNLPAGRAAYSAESLRKLTARILETGEDLHHARKAVFDVGDDWIPPSEPIGAPVGHPAVDRVVKIIARFLLAAESEWGSPERVTIEHVRDAFRSEAAVRQADKDNHRRHQAKLEQRESIGSSVKSEGRIRASDVRRFEAVERQKSMCLYCGDTITFDTAEMDHIVPRRGPGSTNTKVNLAAACIPCNREKSNLPFAVWAEHTARPGVSVKEAADRTKHWLRDPGSSPKGWRMFLAEVRDRLERTDEDPEIDARSMESVAWMANELRERIEAHLRRANVSSGEKRVFVYPGLVTADARRVSGIEGRIPWIGGGGKTRLDRRHHAVDAAILTLVDGSIARTLAERDSLRFSERFRRDGVETWKTYTGRGPQAMERFAAWKQEMDILAHMLADAFDRDEVVVTENLRLRLGSGRVHEDTIRPLTRRTVGSAFSRVEIDAASSPQLWVALTRDPDFDGDCGLPENPSRRLRLQRDWLTASDEVELFDKPRAALKVRGGWAQLGNIHHARFYRWRERGRTKYGMLRVYTIDLLKHRAGDLFEVTPDPSWISMRVAHPSIGRADLLEREYLGWLVPGDEILLTANAPETPSLGRITRWKVRGFEDASRFNVTPLLLASEGLEKFLDGQADKDKVVDLVDGKGRRNVNSFLGEPGFTVIRRDALGRPRLRSAANLPTCWSTD